MKLIIIAALLSVILFSGGCAPMRNFDNFLNSIVKPYRFSMVRWESRVIPHEVKQWIFGRYEKVDDEVHTVTEYFSLVERVKALKSEIEAINAGSRQGDLVSLEVELNMLEGQRASLEGMAERIIARQIKEILAQEGIFNPIIGLKVHFPPLNFKLDKTPYLLVISPRDRIESIREIALHQNIRLEQMEDIEAKVDNLGVSSLVVELGGFGGTYPTFVVNNASLQFTIDTAAEEWLHQYLAFKPLGFRYLLDLTGVSRDYEIATIAETAVSMVSKEIGFMVYEKYYPQCESDSNQNQAAESEFDFNREMREIRRAVDRYLAQGEIERAEEFMEQKRQYLASNGYHIRKLNQAYFAFHGTYADRPTSISPIGVELRKLRSQSVSLKDFLDTVAAMTSYQDLRVSVK